MLIGRGYVVFLSFSPLSCCGMPVVQVYASVVFVRGYGPCDPCCDVFVMGVFQKKTAGMAECEIHVKTATHIIS